MNYTASVDAQWQFILAALTHAESDDDFDHLAAGPLEHLLGFHGAEVIDAVERLAATDPTFLRALRGVWRHLMPDTIWARVQRIQMGVFGDPN